MDTELLFFGLFNVFCDVFAPQIIKNLGEKMSQSTSKRSKNENSVPI